MLKKKALISISIVVLPITTLALSQKITMKSAPHGELYVSDAVINQILYSQKHFENKYTPKESLPSIFEEKKQNNELHFEFLDFTKPVKEKDDDASFQILPLFKRGEVDDYKNTQAICPFCINLVSFKIPFF